MKPSELFKEITSKTGLYNIQAIDNIPSIMKRGLLSYEKAMAINHTSIAMEDVQRRRNNIYIPNGKPLHKYVNLYFSSWNPMLSARRSENERICILRVDSAVLDIEGTVLADRNASSEYAGFYSPMEGLQTINFDMVFARSWTDDNPYEYLKKKSVKCAEALIPYRISYNYIVCAAVVSENAREKMEAAGFDKRIYVQPEAFF
ncbi:MAG: DUF4433 domain-containing protein [Lachnospiraceae bacterium]|nr:DUF4433 domain-containing protein [Lachnospiraceae bacterium]